MRYTTGILCTNYVHLLVLYKMYIIQIQIRNENQNQIQIYIQIDIQTYIYHIYIKYIYVQIQIQIKDPSSHPKAYSSQKCTVEVCEWMSNFVPHFIMGCNYFRVYYNTLQSYCKTYTWYAIYPVCYWLVLPISLRFMALILGRWRLSGREVTINNMGKYISWIYNELMINPNNQNKAK